MTERSKSDGSQGNIPDLVKGEEKVKVGERQLEFLDFSGRSDSSAEWQKILEIYLRVQKT